ncbi:DNA polymerase III subunit alpha [Candidatus Nomurabacteria bacterium]|nr:DNA polymerase III subunit alpha [Candidatus Nomurabacteria bacterium]
MKKKELKPFTHLHLHTEYSLLDGTIRIPALVEKLKSLDMKACAITDHGVMYGAFKFWNTLKHEDIKPIIGCEMYIAPRSHHKKEAGIDNKYSHLVLLAKNLQGYKNLIKLTSIANLEGFYYKPRVDFETLKKYSEGLIATSACMSGVIAREIVRNNNVKQAEENAQRYAEVFKDKFYVEIQRNGLEEQKEVNKELLRIAKKFKLPIVATCDAHYLEKEDYLVQEVLWCIADGRTLDDPTRRSMDSHEFYVKSQEEMNELFADLPEALDNNQKIVDEIEDYSIQFDRVEPEYLDLPKGQTPAEHLRELVEDGTRKKYGKITPEIQERIDYELGIIDDKGYNNYFLVVKDFVKYCVDNGIMVGARGSAVGTIVGYALDIAGVDPISWELYFERFLNPGRDSPPDIDLDISDKRREEVIQYARDKYGEENVRQIITFSKLQTRQAIRDVSRVLGINLQIADQLSKMVQVLFGKAKDIDYMIETNKEFADLIESSSETKQMAEIVRKVAGLCRGVSTHACGVVVTPKPVDEYVPVARDTHEQGIGMAQYDMVDIEYVGLLKLDFLGLRNLNVIDTAINKIYQNQGEKLDLLGIDTEDKTVFEMIQSGNTVGIFQLESEGMKKTIRQLKPESTEELCYLLAAYRPGPMEFIPEYVAVKRKDKEAEYLVPPLKDILSVTNGVITYQEQVMRIATDLAGYSLSDADILRRAMGKKKMEIMEAEKPRFINGGVEKGFAKDKMETIWELLIKFANYGFNKSHSAAYAMVSYYTAYLKTHYPLEYMAALLEGDLDDFNRVVLDLQECERLGIDVLPPSVNYSNHDFSIEEDKNIRFGLAAIKNVGEDIVRRIVSEREKNGLYKNFDDFIFRNIENKLQKRVVEYLIMAGALDELGDRNAMLSALPSFYDRYKKLKEDHKRGQFGLFSGGEAQINIQNPLPMPDVEKTQVFEKLQWEKELLGIYLTSHPLDDLQQFFQSKGAVPIKVVTSMKPSREIIVIGGIVNTVRRVTTKKNESMAFLTVEDKTGQIDMVVFPRVYEELKEEMHPNSPMLFAGRLNERNKEISFVLEKAKLIDPKKFGSNFSGVTFKVRDANNADEIVELKECIKKNPGETSVRIIIADLDNGDREMILNYKIALNDTTRAMIERFS